MATHLVKVSWWPPSVTEESWPPLIESGKFIGFVVLESNVVLSFCFGDTNNGKIIVLIILAGY